MAAQASAQKGGEAHEVPGSCHPSSLLISVASNRLVWRHWLRELIKRVRAATNSPAGRTHQRANKACRRQPLASRCCLPRSAVLLVLRSCLLLCLRRQVAGIRVGGSWLAFPPVVGVGAYCSSYGEPTVGWRGKVLGLKQSTSRCCMFAQAKHC